MKNFEASFFLMTLVTGFASLLTVTGYSHDNQNTIDASTAPIVVEKRKPSRQNIENISHLIEALGAKRFSKRTDATHRLIEMGDIALPRLNDALNTSDQEIITRVRWIQNAIEPPDKVMSLEYVFMHIYTKALKIEGDLVDVSKHYIQMLTIEDLIKIENAHQRLTYLKGVVYKRDENNKSAPKKMVEELNKLKDAYIALSETTFKQLGAIRVDTPNLTKDTITYNLSDNLTLIQSGSSLVFQKSAVPLDLSFKSTYTNSYDYSGKIVLPNGRSAEESSIWIESKPEIRVAFLSDGAYVLRRSMDLKIKESSLDERILFSKSEFMLRSIVIVMHHLMPTYMKQRHTIKINPAIVNVR